LSLNTGRGKKEKVRGGLNREVKEKKGVMPYRESLKVNAAKGETADGKKRRLEFESRKTETRTKLAGTSMGSRGHNPLAKLKKKGGESGLKGTLSRKNESSGRDDVFVGVALNEWDRTKGRRQQQKREHGERGARSGGTTSSGGTGVVN